MTVRDARLFEDGIHHEACGCSWLVASPRHCEGSVHFAATEAVVVLVVVVISVGDVIVCTKTQWKSQCI